MLYTQFMPVKPEHMVELLRIRNECLHKRVEIQPDTQRMLLAGSCAYVVNAASKSRLHSLLQKPTTLDNPVDRYYWQLAREGVLQMRVAFPLPSSVAPEAATSQIQEPSKAQASLLWNVFMRLCAVERDLASIEASLAPLAAQRLPLEAYAQAQAWHGCLDWSLRTTCTMSLRAATMSSRYSLMMPTASNSSMACLPKPIFLSRSLRACMKRHGTHRAERHRAKEGGDA